MTYCPLVTLKIYNYQQIAVFVEDNNCLIKYIYLGTNNLPEWLHANIQRHALKKNMAT